MWAAAVPRSAPRQRRTRWLLLSSWKRALAMASTEPPPPSGAGVYSVAASRARSRRCCRAAAAGRCVSRCRRRRDSEGVVELRPARRGRARRAARSSAASTAFLAAAPPVRHRPASRLARRRGGCHEFSAQSAAISYAISSRQERWRERDFKKEVNFCGGRSDPLRCFAP